MSQAGIRRGRTWIAIGGVLYAYLTAFSASGEEASLVLQKAVVLAAEGRTAEAERAYRQVLEDKTSAAETTARAKLGLARLWGSNSDANTSERLEKTARFYLEASETEGSIRIEALNGLALLRLRQGRSDEAVQLFRTLEEAVVGSSDLDAASRSRFFYNYASAVEHSGQKEKAFALYLKAVGLDPSFRPACDAALRNARAAESQPAVVKRLTALVELLIAKGDLAAAADYLQRSLREREIVGAGSYDALITSLVRYWTAARVGPAGFAKDWKPLLSSNTSWLTPQAGARLKLIEQAYEGPLPVLLERYEGQNFTRDWGSLQESPEAKAFSDFLRMVGDRYLELLDPKAAFPRYALAFSSTGNLDAGVYLTSLLLNERERVDPSGQLLFELTNQLFGGKGGAYLRGDWRSILRFHTLLGTIFERQKRWGSSGDARSAVFQWEHAARALDRLGGAGGSPEPAPGVYAHLGGAYRAVGRKSDALKAYLTSAEQYVSAKRPEQAETLLLRVEELAPAGGAAERDRMETVRGAIERDKRQKETLSSVIRDSDITAAVRAKLAADPELEQQEITIVTEDGWVTLSGAMADKAKAAEVEGLVRSTIGVKGVVPRLE